MVYGIVKRMRGSIEIDSEERKGTCVRILLPTACRQKQAGINIVSPSTKLDTYRLLLIDDDNKVLNALRDGLCANGHRVEVANTGSAGIELFSRAMREGNPFDAVITDLGMPGMDGQQVAEAIKHLNPNCPVTLLTGWGNQLDTLTAPMAHIDAVLAKPPKISEIEALLHDQIQ